VVQAEEVFNHGADGKGQACKRAVGKNRTSITHAAKVESSPATAAIETIIAAA
jgi:hypothetical protein